MRNKNVKKCEEGAAPMPYRFPKYTPVEEDTILDGDQPWYPCFFKGCDEFHFVEEAHLKEHLLNMHQPEAYMAFGLTEWELRNWLPQSSKTSLLPWPVSKSVHGSVRRSTRRSHAIENASRSSVINP